jgi:hypothetical protein
MWPAGRMLPPPEIGGLVCSIAYDACIKENTNLKQPLACNRVLNVSSIRKTYMHKPFLNLILLLH